MTVSQMERRLAALEAEVALLKADRRPQNRWWEKIAGSFANDPLFDEAMRLGREWREEDSLPPRRNGAKQKARRRGNRK